MAGTSATRHALPHQARLAGGYAHLLECAERLRRARQDYDRLLAADDQADELEAAGLVTFEPYSGNSIQLLRDGAAVCSRLASSALEASRGKGRGAWPLP